MKLIVFSLLICASTLCVAMYPQQIEKVFEGKKEKTTIQDYVSSRDVRLDTFKVATK